MDELTLTTLQRPPVQVVRAPRPADLDPSVVQNIAGNRDRLNSLIAQTPGALQSPSISRKVAVLDDLQNQLDLTTNLIQQAPQVVGERIRGRGVTRVGAAPLLEDEIAPLRRNQLELASVIETLKGNLSTARSLASQAARASTSKDDDRLATLQASIEASRAGLTPEEAAQVAAGLDRDGQAINEQRAVEEDLINMKGEAINRFPFQQFIQRILGNKSPEVVIGEIEAESDASLEQDQVEASQEANDILSRTLRQQERELV